jgi:hypothetical protein
MPGGGDSGGGMVVGGPTAGAAVLAGQYQSQAAQAAAAQATEAINTAVNMINKQYQQARYDVQPYRTTGVQALDQLNQYMGLDPYNPGDAPTAPTKKTYNDFLDKIDNSSVRNYINNNTIWTPSTNKLGQTFLHAQYVGDGVAPGMQGYKDATTGSDGGFLPAGIFAPGSASMGGSQFDTSGSNYFLSNPDVMNAAKIAIGNQMANQANVTYEGDLEAYNRNLDEYNQNKAWYDQYSAAGPLTSAQVTEKISNLPGYQAQMNQGVDAIQKAGSSQGFLGSGRILKELSSFGQNTMSQFYGQELSRLAGLAGGGQAAATQSSANAANQSNALGSLYQSLGDSRANAQLASGNALAQALLAGNQQYRTIGGGGGGGMGGFGSVLGGLGSLASAFM